MKKYIILAALLSGFAPWRVQAMNQAAQQADLTVITNDDQEVIIPGNRIHYFQTMSDMMMDTDDDADQEKNIPKLGTKSQSTMQQLLADIQ